MSLDEEQPGELAGLSLKQKRLRKDLIMLYNSLIRDWNHMRVDLFSQVTSDGMSIRLS